MSLFTRRAALAALLFVLLLPFSGSAAPADELKTLREAAAAMPNDPEMQQNLMDTLLHLGFQTDKIQDAAGYLKETSAVYLKLAAQPGAKPSLQNAATAATAATFMTSLDRNDQENYAMAEKTLQALRSVKTAAGTPFSRQRGVLASNLAAASKDPKQRAALFEEARTSLRADLKADPAPITKLALMNCLTWEAVAGSDAALKQARYAEAMNILRELDGFDVAKALLLQYQANDAPDAAARDRFLAQAESIARDGLGRTEPGANENPVQKMRREQGRSIYQGMLAANAAVRGDAAGSLALVKELIRLSPGRAERYESFVRNVALFDKVRSDPAFAAYMKELRGGSK